jgi:uncharacterized protein (DUF362 family)
MKAKKNSPKQVKRRDFVKIMSLTGVGGLVVPKSAFASVLSPDATSKVVIVADTDATDKTTKTVNTDVVKNMVDTGIKTYTGIDDIGMAWKSIFDGITVDSIIGLKVNTLFSTRNTGTHPQVAYAVAEGLTQMDFNGTKFPENNIIIFDFHTNYLTTQGYTRNTTDTGIRCFHTTQYTSESYDIGGVSIRLSKIITDTITFMVNIAYLKQHFLSGVSLCLKNHYGSIHNPEVSPLLHNSSKYGSPYIAAINALEPIKSKQKFCIIDALYGVTVNGPSGSPNVNPDKILMGQDVVAVDTTGREMLKSLGLAAAQLNKTAHIDVAANTYSLGTNNLNNIEVINVDNSLSGINDYQNNKNAGRIFSNSPNPFSNETEISFYLPATGHVQIKIYTYTGRLVAQLVNKKLEEGMHTLRWEGFGSSGNDLPNGVYVCELKTSLNSLSILMQKFKQ